MTRFEDVLQQIGDRLTIPQPARSRVLLEIAADMEDHYEALLAVGHSEEDAKQRTLEQFGPSDNALHDLVDVHSTAVSRFLDRFSQQAQSRWERGLLATIVLFAAIVGAGPLRQGRWLAGMNEFAWPVLIVAAIGFLLTVTRVYSLFIKKDHDLRRLRSGLSPLIALALAELLLGFGGAWVGLFLTVSKILDDMESASIYLSDWMLRGSATLCFSMLAAMILALAWMLLAARAAAIEQAEAALLLRPRTTEH
jgi:hypothetical protein